jgi:hypothetical protein
MFSFPFAGAKAIQQGKVFTLAVKIGDPKGNIKKIKE